LLISFSNSSSIATISSRVKLVHLQVNYV
jgi:hypothetical protein